MKENNQNPILDVKAKDPPFPQNPHKLAKTIVLIFLLIFGVLQISIGAILAIFAPMLGKGLNLGVANNASVYVSYIPILILVLIGVFNIVNFIKLIKNSLALKNAAFFLSISFLAQFFLVAGIVYLTVFYPVYSYNTQIENATKKASSQISTWRTIKDDKFGFYFKYPDQVFRYTDVSNSGADRFYLSGSTTNQKFTPYQSVRKLDIYVSIFPESVYYKTLEDYVEKEKRVSKDLSHEAVMIDGVQAAKITEYYSSRIPDTPVYMYIFKNGSNFFLFTLSHPDPKELEKNKQILDKILSTFKFTDQTEGIDDLVSYAIPNGWQKYNFYNESEQINLLSKNGSFSPGTLKLTGRMIGIFKTKNMSGSSTISSFSNYQLIKTAKIDNLDWNLFFGCNINRFFCEEVYLTTKYTYLWGISFACEIDNCKTQVNLEKTFVDDKDTFLKSFNFKK